MKIKKFFQNLSNIRVKFEIYDENRKENEKLAKEFNEAKENFQILNFQKIMLKLIDYERTNELAFSGLLLTDDVATQRALARFQQAKRDGRIDELNNIIKVEEQV